MVSSRKSLVLGALLYALIPSEANARFENVVPVAPVVDERELDCMTQNIYYEAPDEPYEGKLAVATVTMNRVEHPRYPQTVCEVVYQPWQFSWTMVKRKPISRNKRYEEAEDIAREVIYGGKRLRSISNSMYYHNQTVTPKWSQTMHPIRRIGEHTFYVERKRQRANSSLSHYATFQYL